MSAIPDWVRQGSTSLLTVVGFLGVWQLLVTVLAVPTWLLPAPSAIWVEFMKNSHVLWKHIVATGSGAIGGLVIGSLGGILLAIVMVQSRLLERILMPLLVIDQSIPKMALAPIFVIWFGFGITPKLIVIALICFFPVVVNTLDGLEGVDRDQVKMMRTLGASRLDLLRRLELPSALPFLFSGAKVAVAVAVIGAVFGELVGSDAGLGHAIQVGTAELETARVFAAVLLLSLMAIALFGLVALVERRAVPWARTSGERR